MSGARTIRPNYYRVPTFVRMPGQEAERRATQLVELECQDLIEALGLDFNTGNAMKYLFRAGRKTENRLEDLKKIATYIQFAIDAERGTVLGPADPSADSKKD